MRLNKNAYMCLWLATDNKHIYVFLEHICVLRKHILVCKFKSIMSVFVKHSPKDGSVCSVSGSCLKNFSENKIEFLFF